ncbi:MAG: glycosyltransferase [Candidatus Omnitrophica bacterium]|nr:glycosyltransferase [Candidatus Omnitrophota bacterium]
MEQLKILHAITRLDKGGSAFNTLLSAMGSAQRGYLVDLLYGATTDTDPDLLARVEASGVHLLEEKELVRDICFAKDLKAYSRIKKVIRTGKYDVVHAHSSKAGFLARLAARKCRVKCVVYTPHGHVFYGYFSRFLSLFSLALERFAAGYCDRIIGLTGSECREWLRFGVGAPEMFRVVPSGLEFDRIAQRKRNTASWKTRYGIGEAQKIIGAVGRFVDIKGFEYFIRAAIDQLSKRDDVVFVLVGDGPMKSDYIRMVAGSGHPDRIKILPWQDNVDEAISSFDVFVMPSLNEGMGRVLIEAMFFGKPVIASRVGGVPSILEGGCGILVSPGNPYEISGAIDRFLEDPAMAAETASKGKQKALTEYSADNMVEKLEEVYREVLEEKSK